MSETPDPKTEKQSDLDRISTQWSQIHDRNHFLVRYAVGVRSYLEALLHNGQDAEDVAQEFFVRVVERGFERADQDRGRFRDYLKIAVRNAALSHLRRQQRLPTVLDATQVQFVVSDSAQNAADQEWLDHWRRCLMERAWRALERHQRSFPGNLYWTVLRLAVDHPQDDSPALAARASEQAGRPLRADTFRKQLSRARRLFAELLVHEVVQTLENPTPIDIEEELTETGLLRHVLPFLPPDWRTRGELSEAE